MADPIVMYIVVNKGLEKLGWNVGTLLAQASHATSKAVWTFRDDPMTVEYFKNMESLRKVTLQAKDDKHLLELSQELHQQGLDHVVWREQPEDLITCLATKPMLKSSAGGLKKLKLYT
ncbi:peptidyl-tRNA hydrolase II domain-containing protein [Gorgonomyces haynaldii]|nr:peptidyl-tRNA hydrolase II domain-containing protein [Gorgonomyces haynaldii]